MSRRLSGRALTAVLGAVLFAGGLVVVPLLVGDTYGAVSCGRSGGGSGSVLEIDLTGSGDAVTIDRSGTDIVLSGGCTLTTAMNVLESIDVDGASGNQTVTINLDNGGAGGEAFEPAMGDGLDETGESWYGFAGVSTTTARSGSDGTTSTSSTTFSSPTASFTSADVGHGIIGTGIGNGSTIVSVTNSTTAVLSVNGAANTTGTSTWQILGNTDEIEIDIDLGSGSESAVTGRQWQTGDRVIFEGDTDGDFLAFGGSGSTTTRASIANDHQSATAGADDADADVFFTNVEQIEVRGNAGNDTISNGNSNNTVQGGSTDRARIPMIILGGTGADTISGSNVADFIDGGQGNDPSITGAQGEDVIVAGLGADGSSQLMGDDGDDVIVGGQGNDLNIRSGNNDDYLWEGDCYATRTVTDGVLNSSTTVTSATASFTAADVGHVITGTGIPAAATISSVTNSTTIVLTNAATATSSGVSLTIVGNQTACTTAGATHNGTDSINANASNFAAGIDTISYFGRQASISVPLTNTSCSAGTNITAGQSGEADLVSTRTENIVGGSGNDTLAADPCTTDTAENWISPGPGDDTVTGGGGNDTVNYGPLSVGRLVTNNIASTIDPVTVAQFVSWALQEGAHTATADSGYTVYGVVPAGDSTSACDAAHNLDADSDATNNDGVIVDLSVASAQDTYCAGTETITNINGAIGTLFNDRLTGNANTNHLHGLDGNDYLDGATGSENTALAQGVWRQLSTHSGAWGVPIITQFVNKNCTACSNVTTNFGMSGGNGNDFLRGGDGADNMFGGDGDDTFDQPSQTDPSTDPDNMSGGNHVTGDTANYATVGRVNPWRATREGRAVGANDTTVTITALAGAEVTSLGIGHPGTANDGQAAVPLELDNVWSDVEFPTAPTSPTISDLDTTIPGADGRDFTATWTLDASLKGAGATALTEQRVYVLPEGTALNLGTHTAIAGWTFTGSQAQIEPTARTGTASTTKTSAGTRFPNSLTVPFEIHVLGYIGTNVVSYAPTVSNSFNTNGAGAAFIPEGGTPGAASRLVFTEQPSNVTAGAVMSPSVVVQVQDSTGTPCTDTNTICSGGANGTTSDPNLSFAETITISVEPGTPSSGGVGNVLGGTLTGNIDWTCGCVTFSNLTMSKVGTAYKFKAVETYNGSTSPLTDATDATASTAFNVTGGAPAALVWTTQPTNPTQPGSSFTVAVQVQDSQGNAAAEPSASLTETIQIFLDSPLAASNSRLDLSVGTNDNADSSVAVDVNWTTSTATFSTLNIDETGNPYKFTAQYDADSVSGGQQSPLSADSQDFEIAQTGAFVFTDPGSDGGTKTAGDFNVSVQLQQPGPAEITSDPDADPGNAESVTIVCTHSDTTTVFTNQNSTSPITGQTFSWSGSAGGGTVTFPVRATKAGTYSCVTSNPINFNDNPTQGTRTIVVVADVANKIEFASQPATNSAYAAGANITGNTNPFSVQVLDQFDNPVNDNNRPITLEFVNNAGPGAVMTNNVVNTNASGLATFSTLSLNKVGNDYTIRGTATIGSAKVTSTSTNFDIVSGAPATLAWTSQPLDTTANSTLGGTNVVVTVRDASGNAVTGTNAPTGGDAERIKITLRRASADQAELDTTGNNENAIFQFANVDWNTGTGTFVTNVDLAALDYTLVAEYDTTPLTDAVDNGGVSSAESNQFDIAHGPFDHFIWSIQPQDAIAGETITGTDLTPGGAAIQVKAEDAFGNAVMTDPDSSGAVVETLTLSKIVGTGTVSGTVLRDIDWTDGLTDFPGLSINLVGNDKQLRATGSSNLPGGTKTADSAVFAIFAAAPAALDWTTEPAAQTDAGATLGGTNVVVTVKDQFGNVVTTASPTGVTLNTNGVNEGVVASLLNAAGAASAQLDTGGVHTGNATELSVNIDWSTGTATYTTDIDLAGIDYDLVAAYDTNTAVAGVASGGVTGDTVIDFDIVAAAPAKLSWTTEPAATTNAGATLGGTNVVVTVLDAFDNIVTSASPNAPVGGVNEGVVASLLNAAGAASAQLDTGGVHTGNATELSVNIDWSTGTATYTTDIDLAGIDYDLVAAYDTNTAVAGVASGGVTGDTVIDFDIVAAAPAVLDWTAEPTPQPGATTAGTNLGGGTITVTVKDAFGNVVTGLNAPSGGVDEGVVITLMHGGNPSAQLDTGGVHTGNATNLSANVNWTTGTASYTTDIDLVNTSYTLVAAYDTDTAIAGVNSGAVTGETSIPFNVKAAAPSKIIVLGPCTSNTEICDDIVLDPLGPVVVEVRDPFDNPVLEDPDGGPADETITITVNDPCPGAPVRALGGTTTALVDWSTGRATFSNLTLDEACTDYVITGTPTGIPGVTDPDDSNPFDVVAAGPGNLAFTTQPTNTTAGSNINPVVVVQVRDGGNNAVTVDPSGTKTEKITIAFGANPCTPAGQLDHPGGTNVTTMTVNVVWPGGTATFTGLNIDEACDDYTFTATYDNGDSVTGGVTGATSNQFDITAGPATGLVWTVQPNSTVAGQPIRGLTGVKIKVVDSFGNTVKTDPNPAGGQTESIVLSKIAGTGTLSTTGSLTGAIDWTDGETDFIGLSINLVGIDKQLRAVASGGGITGSLTADSAIFPITHAAASQLVFKNPIPDDTPLDPLDGPVVIEVQDPFGNPIVTDPGGGTETITVTLNPPLGCAGVLSGTMTGNVSWSTGQVAFPNLLVSAACVNYTLTGTPGGIPGPPTDATSDQFNIAAGPNLNLPYITIDVSPDNPRTEQVVTATILTFGDADPGETSTMNWTYKWYVNGLLQKTTANTRAMTDTYDLAPKGKGDLANLITAIVTPHDGRDAGPSANETVTVANTPPTATSRTVTIAESTGGAPTSAMISLTGDDPDNQSLVFRITSLPSSGALTYESGGTQTISSASLANPVELPNFLNQLTYTPATNNTTDRTFSFQVADVNGSTRAWTSTEGVVTIKHRAAAPVVVVQDPPVASSSGPVREIYTAASDTDVSTTNPIAAEFTVGAPVGINDVRITLEEEPVDRVIVPGSGFANLPVQMVLEAEKDTVDGIDNGIGESPLTRADVAGQTYFTLVFTLDNSLLPVPLDATSVGLLKVYRNSAEVPSCTGSGDPDDVPATACVFARALSGTDIRIEVHTNAFSDWNFAAPLAAVTSITVGPQGATNAGSPNVVTGGTIQFDFTSAPIQADGNTYLCSLWRGGDATPVVDTDGDATNEPIPCGSVDDGTGTFTYGVGGDPDDLYTFRVQAAAGGNIARRDFVLDRTAPSASIVSGPANASTTTSSSVTFGYTSDDVAATFSCKLDLVVPVACNPSPKSYTGLTNGVHTFTLEARDAANNTTTVVRTFTVAAPRSDDPTTTTIPRTRTGTPLRVAGADRTETAELISRIAFPNGADTVYIATERDYADALSAGPGAVFDEAPVLLTPVHSLDGDTAGELVRLQPRRIVVMGGWAAVDDEVFALLQGFADEVVRLAGVDRFETAVELSKDKFPNGTETVYVATGRSYPDALAGGLAAASGGSPVLLTEPNVLPGVTAEEIMRLRPDRIVVVGGTGAVSRGLEALLADYAPLVERVSGTDRYETTATVDRMVIEGTDTVFIVTGKTFGDALTGIPVAALTNSAVLMVGDGELHEAVIAELQRLQPKNVIILGGTAAVAERVSDQLAQYLGEGTGDGERGMQLDQDDVDDAMEASSAARRERLAAEASALAQ